VRFDPVVCVVNDTHGNTKQASRFILSSYALAEQKTVRSADLVGVKKAGAAFHEHEIFNLGLPSNNNIVLEYE
jgi:hypothetical protein